MRIVFLGASELGWECCRSLLEIGEQVVGIVTAPRTFRISWSASPVTNVRHRSFEDLANQAGIPLLYMETRMSDPEYLETVRQLAPDLLVVIGWYHMVPRSWRSMARHGAVGVHASLLPKYRGGAPLVWAVINGEKETGVSLFYLEDGVDTGNVIAQEAFPIAFTDDIGDVVSRATHASISLVREYIPKIRTGMAPSHSQDHSQATLVPQRKPEDGLLDWRQKTALEAYNWIRAQTRPYPGAYTFLHEEKVIIWRARAAMPGTRPRRQPGQIETEIPEASDAIGVWAADGQLVLLTELQLVDGRRLTGSELALSFGLRPGMRLGLSDPAE